MSDPVTADAVNNAPAPSLQRGFAVVHGPDGVLTRAGAVTSGLELRLQFADGEVGAVAAGAAAKPAAAKSKPKPKPMLKALSSAS